MAIASQRHWCLIEPRRRRAAFLEEAVRTLGLDCEVVARSVEELAEDPSFQGAHALVTARALAPPTRAFELVLSLVRAGGVAAVFVGEGAEIPRGAGEWAPGIATMPGTGNEGAWE
jgi:16S rRNA G527 N7-methylase RsmG